MRCIHLPNRKNSSNCQNDCDEVQACYNRYRVAGDTLAGYSWGERDMNELLSILGWSGGTHTQVKEAIKITKINNKNNGKLSSVRFLIGDKEALINKYGVGIYYAGEDVIKGYNKVRTLTYRLTRVLTDIFEKQLHNSFQFSN